MRIESLIVVSKMGGSLKSKSVTWPSDEYLCQVRLFLSEETPSQVASSAQDHLQEKTLCATVPSGTLTDETLPPGFEGSRPVNTVWCNLSQKTLIKWKCPPKYMVNGSWRVVAGEESKEVQVQNLREMRFLEAIYPKPSDIPSNPLVILEEDSSHDDHGCPLIPINPIEDEDVAADTPDDSGAVNTAPMSLQPLPTLSRTPSSFDPDVLAAAHAALSRLIGNNNQQNAIDSELLMKILTDPKTIEQLVKNHGGAATNTQSVPPALAPLPSAATQGLHLPVMPSNNYYSLPASVSHASAPLGGFYAPPARGVVHESVQGGPSSSPLVVNPVSRDMNYYKSLIQQHGGEIHDSNIPQLLPGYLLNSSSHHLGISNNFKARELKQKMKPCIYFNTSRGCRNGANCTFQHDASHHPKVVANNNSIPDTQNAKRLKTDWRITGS